MTNMTPPTVPYLDLRVTDDAEREDLLAAVDRVLRHGRIVLGPEVAEFEARIAARVGRRFAVGVNSGTDALILALRALGIGAGDEVIVPALSFVASANIVKLAGAVPVFADLGPDMNMDPAVIEGLITPATRAILPVHFAGKICRMEEICAIAERHRLLVIEDAAQAFDAVRHGRKAGSFGQVGCFSMNCMKVLASLGEAGVIVTDDDALHDHLVQLRYHGLVTKESCGFLSHNGRLDTVHAAMLSVRLDRFDEVMRRRRDNAAYYSARLGHLVDVPRDDADCQDAYYIYVIATDRRDALQDFLTARGIETKQPHILMPEHPVHKDARGFWDNAARVHHRRLSLPISEKLTDTQRTYVADAIVEFFNI
ncbi:Predicted pyridoxal phosphate-dependent enzyme [Paramagnetospirillum magneticum AMB-1]|uniref:Predicted pyridoxal phosphate-dependent enzyme n=2 Tax=Paramagnetospirillum magneticum TaxID=84159 RepID=Q2WB96_PARM1|nr:Predicted pyridoxal phosphate-dependent enzyme [Paramagnetospirillum magneticum AMB-1]